MSEDRLTQLQSRLISKEVALEKLAPYEDCKELLVKGPSEFDFHPYAEKDFVMRYNNSEYSVSNDAFTKLNRLVGIPAPYTMKVPPQLMFPHLSYWLNEGMHPVKAFVREENKDKEGRPIISGFAREDAFYYPISRLLEQVDKVRPDYLIEGLEDISWRNSTFGIVFPEHEFMVDLHDEVKKGDFLYGGIKIRMSILGEFASKLSAFLLTLACLNGMVSRDEVYTYNKRGGFDGVDEWVIDGIKNGITALNVEVEKVTRLTSITIPPEAIASYVSHIFDRVGTSQKTREAVLENIISKAPRNLYELMNAVTEVAHTIENRGEVYALQALGGFVASHADSCEKCHRPF